MTILDAIRQDLQSVQTDIVRFKTLADAAARASDALEEKELKRDIEEYEVWERLLKQALSQEKQSDCLLKYAEYKRAREACV